MQKLLIFTLLMSMFALNLTEVEGVPTHTEEAWYACLDTVRPYVRRMSKIYFLCKYAKADTHSCILSKLDIGNRDNTEIDFDKLHATVLEMSKKTPATKYLRKALDDGYCKNYSDEFDIFEYSGCITVRCGILRDEDN